MASETDEVERMSDSGDRHARCPAEETAAEEEVKSVLSLNTRAGFNKLKSQAVNGSPGSVSFHPKKGVKTRKARDYREAMVLFFTNQIIFRKNHFVNLKPELDFTTFDSSSLIVSSAPAKL